MSILTNEDVSRLHEAAIAAGLGASRHVLLSGLALPLVASLVTAPAPGGQILADLGVLNVAGMLADGSVPLVTWLQNARSLVGPRREAVIFERALERCEAYKTALRHRSTAGSSGAAALARGVLSIDERSSPHPPTDGKNHPDESAADEKALYTAALEMLGGTIELVRRGHELVYPDGFARISARIAIVAPLRVQSQFIRVRSLLEARSVQPRPPAYEELRQELDHLASLMREALPQGAAGDRPKHPKFRILDSPDLLQGDLLQPAGALGRAIVYFDLDDFKQLNSRYTETLVDRDLLPAVQRVVVAAALGIGRAYAEGGDEMIVLLSNASLDMAAAFADALRGAIASASFAVEGEKVHVTASFGVAAGPGSVDGAALRQLANRAKKHAKENGKNCVSIAVDGSYFICKRKVSGR